MKPALVRVVFIALAGSLGWYGAGWYMDIPIVHRSWATRE